MKVIISTFNNSKSNYGALFQSCGLYSFLSKMGYDVSNLTLKKRKMKKKRKIIILKQQLKKIITIHRRFKFSLREKKLLRFAEETQNQIVYKNKEELYSNPPIADVYISGSDQVWNPVAMHEDLLLAYVPKGKRKISYAASMGNEIVPEKNVKKFSQLISGFDSVSVREDTMIDIIKEYTDKPVHQHIDPVFLKLKSEWEELESPYKKIKFEKYILTYIIEWNNDFNKKLQELKTKTRLPVVSINLGNLKKVCSDQVIYDASPCEFLYLLHNCEYMVATSFHGTAMSIVYNKPFLSLSGFNLPTRIQSLLRHFGIDETKSLEYGDDEFERINEIILQDRKAAEDYFRKVII